jgi:ABC-type Fe2+-enterobactin transport system substrate-binding protein
MVTSGNSRQQSSCNQWWRRIARPEIQIWFSAFGQQILITFYAYLRPTAPPLRINFTCKGGQSLTIELNDHSPQTRAQVTAIFEKYITNTPGREIMTICESLLASNAILFKTNAELVANTRKSKKSSRKLNTEARYLTKELAQQLRNEATAKENVK